MSDSETREELPADATKGAKAHIRQNAQRRPKKSAKALTPENEPQDADTETSSPPLAAAETPAEATFSIDHPPASNDWPEPEPASTGDSAPREGSKRKRKRKKGKGGGQPNHASDAQTNTNGDAGGNPPPSRPPQERRLKVDPEKVAKLALKIYLAEVSEEGVALISDNDARELSRRCFRLAEVFIEEEARHH